MHDRYFPEIREISIIRFLLHLNILDISNLLNDEKKNYWLKHPFFFGNFREISEVPRNTFPTFSTFYHDGYQTNGNRSLVREIIF